jgi:hypothetical protein
MQETHLGKEHLHRYLSELDFRYNARKLRLGGMSLLATEGIDGMRLLQWGSLTDAAENN